PRSSTHSPSFPTRRSSDLASREHGRREQQQEDHRRDQERLGAFLVDRDELAPADGVLELLAGLGRDGDRGHASQREQQHPDPELDRKSTRLNSSHVAISYA